MKFRLLILMMPLLFSVRLSAQSSITGTVRDSSDKRPLAGVTVYIPSLQRLDITDSSGRFLITSLRPGILYVQFSCIGYKTRMVNIAVAQGTSVELSLVHSASQLDEVLVTTGYTGLSDRTPYPVLSVSGDEYRKYASPSLMGNLSYLPGVDKISLGNGVAKPVIRGMSFNQLLLHAYGTRIENQQWDDHHDLGITDVGLDQVEIVKGPAALLYGSDAMGGALIFHAEKPAAGGTHEGDIRLGYESNTQGIRLDGGVKAARNDGLFYGLRIGINSQTSYLQGEGKGKELGEEEEFAFNSKYLNGTGKLNAGISRPWGSSQVTYIYTLQEIGIVEDEVLDSANMAKELKDQRERESEAPYQDVQSHIVSNENVFYTGTSKIGVNLSWQFNDRKEYEPLPGKQKELAIGLKLNVLTADVNWTTDASKPFGVTVGTQLSLLDNSNFGLISLVPDATSGEAAAYGIMKYEWKKLLLTGGVRINHHHLETTPYTSGETDFTYILHHQGNPVPDTVEAPAQTQDRNDAPFSWSLGAVIKPADAWAVKINGASGFTEPNYAQLSTFGKHEGTYRFERGNARLGIQHNMQGDAEVSWENPSIRLYASGYSNQVKDYIYIAHSGDTMVRVSDAVTDTLPVYDYIQDDAHLYGFEAGFTIKPAGARWLQLLGSWAVTKGTLTGGNPVTYMPAPKITFEARLTKEKIGKMHAGYFAVVFSHYAAQEHVASYEISSAGYSLIDLHAGISFGTTRSIRLEVFCTNLFDEAYYSQLSLVKYIGVRDMGRNIGLSVSMALFNKKS